jgi:tRNA/rRNA methyltransferase
MKKTIFENIDIILTGTLKSGNIGSVARAMSNMGLSCLKLVNPQCAVDDQAFWMATHGADILRNAKTFPTIRDAIADCSYVFGTTARSRRWRDFLYPGEMSEKVAVLARQNRISIVFGPEDMGLSNDDLELCNQVVSIPTADEAASLNVSHAVMVICYEIFRAVEKKNETHETMELAEGEKVEEMYDHMRKALLEIGYLNPQNPDHVMGKFRRIMTRAGLTSQDVNLIRGVFRQLLWYIKKKK